MEIDSFGENALFVGSQVPTNFSHVYHFCLFCGEMFSGLFYPGTNFPLFQAIFIFIHMDPCTIVDQLYLRAFSVSSFLIFFANLFCPSSSFYINMFLHFYTHQSIAYAPRYTKPLIEQFKGKSHLSRLSLDTRKRKNHLHYFFFLYIKLQWLRSS